MGKSSIAELFSSQSIAPSSWLTVLFSILIAFGIGFFIFWVYKTNYRGVMFSTNFGLTLILMTLITTPVVMCIKSSIELSMGMVGALSIVRFRTAVKDPLDTAYMFWALTMGILLGAGQFFLAILAVVAIAALIFLLNHLNTKPSDSYLLVMRVNGGAENMISQALAKSLKYQRLKSKSVTRNGVEVTYEVRTERAEALLNKLLQVDGVEDATLVSYQSESI